MLITLRVRVRVAGKPVHLIEKNIYSTVIYNHEGHICYHRSQLILRNKIDLRETQCNISSFAVMLYNHEGYIKVSTNPKKTILIRGKNSV